MHKPNQYDMEKRCFFRHLCFRNISLNFDKNFIKYAKKTNKQRQHQHAELAGYREREREKELLSKDFCFDSFSFYEGTAINLFFARLSSTILLLREQTTEFRKIVTCTKTMFIVHFRE